LNISPPREIRPRFENEPFCAAVFLTNIQSFINIKYNF
jgi:hypothetical protein